MAAKRNPQQNDVSRRDFAVRLGAAVAGVAVGGELVPTLLHGAPHVGNRILGANDRVVFASIGIRGQGNSLKRGFARLANVEIKTLCDIDANLAPERINDARLADVADVQARVRAGPAARARRQGHRRRRHRHAESLARARHDLGAPGRQARLRREALLAHGVGRPQDGRGGGALQQDRAGRHDEPQPPGGAPGDQVPARRRHRQGLHGARPLLQAAALHRQVSRRADGGRREVRADGDATTLRADLRRSSTLSKVDYDLWLGPAPKRPFNRNRFHYNWHWHWDYGNGDTGNQGPHQFDIARWGLNKHEHPVKIRSVGGYFGAESSQETPDMQTSLFEYADGTVLEFATRGEFTNDEGTQRIGNLFYGSKGWLWIDGDGRKWQSYLGPEEREGAGRRLPPDTRPRQRSARPDEHRVAALPELHRRDPRERSEAAHCDVLEGHLSSTLPHLANISYRVGRSLVFDGKTEKFVNDKKADRLLTREYRKGFEIPKSLSVGTQIRRGASLPSGSPSRASRARESSTSGSGTRPRRTRCHRRRTDSSRRASGRTRWSLTFSGRCPCAPCRARESTSLRSARRAPP